MLWTHREHLGASVTSHVYRCTFVQLQAKLACISRQVQVYVCLTLSPMATNIPSTLTWSSTFYSHMLCAQSQPQVHPRNQSLYVCTRYVCLFAFSSSVRIDAQSHSHIRKCVLLIPSTSSATTRDHTGEHPHKYPWLSV